MLNYFQEPLIEEVVDQRLENKAVRLFIKREDQIHPFVSGNKWRKLKYNLLAANTSGFTTLLTFGGAYSNHIYATAAAARETGFEVIGIIRGEEHVPLNPTLKYASDQGMRLYYMDRATYRRKHEEDAIAELRNKFGDFFLIPEGGTNNLAIKGCEELVTDEVRKFDQVCVPVGTGGTIAGVISGMRGIGKVVGFSVLKGDFLQLEVKKLLQNYQDEPPINWRIINDYHFGGYAKVKPELSDFIDDFYKKHRIQLEPIYTGKMMYGIYDLIKRDRFSPGSRILAIHTGGLQGRKGFS